MINSIKVTAYAFFIHLGISVIGTFVVVEFIGLFGGLDIMKEGLINFLHFTSISIFYIASGYFLDNIMHRKTSMMTLFSPLIFGIFLWIVCFLDSPNSIDWKGSGKIWFYYILYVADYSTSLTGFVRSFERWDNDYSQMYFSSIYSAIPSIFLVIGVLLRRKLSFVREVPGL